jgi:hypothetical protein
MRDAVVGIALNDVVYSSKSAFICAFAALCFFVGQFESHPSLVVAKDGTAVFFRSGSVGGQGIKDHR